MNANAMNASAPRILLRTRKADLYPTRRSNGRDRNALHYTRRRHHRLRSFAHGLVERSLAILHMHREGAAWLLRGLRRTNAATTLIRVREQVIRASVRHRHRQHESPTKNVGAPG